MSIKDKRIAILIDNYFEQPEFEIPLNFFKQLGANVAVIGVSTKEPQGMWSTELGDTFQTSTLLQDATSEDYDALIVPGGVFNADSLRTVPKARKWISDFLDDGKLVAAICHAPWLLISADTVEGRRITSYPSLEDDIRNAGGEWIDAAVVVDGNFITSRGRKDLDDFVHAIKAWLDLEANKKPK